MLREMLELAYEFIMLMILSILFILLLPVLYAVDYVVRLFSNGPPPGSSFYNKY